MNWELAPLSTAAGAAALIGAAGLAAALWLHMEATARRARRRRLEALIVGDAVGPRPSARSTRKVDRGRRRQIDQTLRDIADRQRDKIKRTRRQKLAARIRQAGLSWSRGTYLLICVGAALATYALTRSALGLGPAPSALFAVAGGVGGPHLLLARLRAARFKTYLGELPDALDVIVRGVRSGIPLNDCLRMIAADGREPLRTEFRLLTEDLAIGLTIDEASERLYDRSPILEVRLLGIILSIQNKAGGSLGEAIGNLSRVLRERRKMHAKIRAMSTEATASAAIIGALPPLVAGLLYLTSPDYLAPLFTTFAGQAALAAGGVWMAIGILVMRKMINFEV